MIIRSPHPDVEIPDRPLTEWLFECAERHGDKPAFIDGPSGRTITFRQWIDRTRAAAGGLAARGFGKGDVLAIFSPNHPEYTIAFHGAALAGGIVTTVNPLYTVGELRFQLEDSKAVFLLTVPALLDKSREAAKGTEVREIFVFDEFEDVATTGATPFSELLETGTAPPDVAIDPSEDLIALPYSSGTTGLAKGVMLTHRNLVANVEQTVAAAEYLGTEETMLGLLPFFHIYGMLCILNDGLRVGATVITMPRFEMEPFLTTIRKYRITLAHLVPPIILGLAKHPAVEDHDLSSLRTICSGAAPLGADVARECAKRVDCHVTQGYGLTETSPVTHLATLAIAEEDPGSIGCAVPNTEVKVLDPETGEALPHDRPGEICIRGPQVMKGYLNRPEATAEMIDTEGWLHTGDIGFAGADGRVRIVDRLKELIKFKGFQVAPAELEAILLGHPAVADAAVIGVADEIAGELPKAFLVLRDEIPLEEVQAFVAQRVAPFKKIRLVERVDAIPKSPSGKILRRVLVDRERARNGS